MPISNIDNLSFINLDDTFIQHVLQIMKNVIFDRNFIIRVNNMHSNLQTISLPID